MIYNGRVRATKRQTLRLQLRHRLQPGPLRSTPLHSAALKQLSQARNLYKFFTLTSKQCEKFALDAAAAIVDAEVCLLPWRPF